MIFLCLNWMKRRSQSDGRDEFSDVFGFCWAACTSIRIACTAPSQKMGLGGHFVVFFTGRELAFCSSKHFWHSLKKHIVGFQVVFKNQWWFFSETSLWNPIDCQDLNRHFLSKCVGCVGFDAWFYVPGKDHEGSLLWGAFYSHIYEWGKNSVEHAVLVLMTLSESKWWWFFAFDPKW